MDFLKIKTQALKRNRLLVFPEFVIKQKSDILVQGKKFFAIWDEEKEIWSKDEFRAIELIDRELAKERDKLLESSDASIDISWVSHSSSQGCRNFKQFLASSPDSFVEFDMKLTFANDERTKKDYFTKRLGYSLGDGSIECYDKMMSVLYFESERRKFEWAIGSIIAGDSVKIQKFFTFFGDSGTGKSTVLNIIQMLFDGYYAVFDGKALTSGQPGSFATEAFKNNPLVAIQHDGDLSNVRDNSLFNSITSHEEIVVNEKYKSAHPQRINCLLFMATNKPVKITDSKSGLMRRLIDIRPTGHLIPPEEFDILMEGIKTELGAIAKHCLSVYKKYGFKYYYHYRPMDMMEQTDHFFNFVSDNAEVLGSGEPIQLTTAFRLYKEYCDDALIEYRLPKYKFKQELKSYFKDFKDQLRVDDKRYRNVYVDFRNLDWTARNEEESKKIDDTNWLNLKQQESLFDIQFAECFAQLANRDGVPSKAWDKNRVRLKDISTDKVHYVRLPENHVVIDFDIKNEKGEKDFEKNIAAASKWPKTYAELSKSGAGVHLHYIFTGDTSGFDSKVPGLEDVEVKIFRGKASLRRKLSLCNDVPIKTLSSWPFEKKEVRKMYNKESFRGELTLRKQIERCLKKEVHDKTKPNVDFIFKLLDEAYGSGQHYDIRDMRGKVLTFAMKSTNNAEYCVGLVQRMHFNSDDCAPPVEEYKSDEIVIFDCEVFPNLFLVNWKFLGEDKKIVRMINPKPNEIEEFVKFKIVGFNNRRYDNHILYGAMLGYSNMELYRLSQKIINGERGFEEAYNLSYTDIYDFLSAANKKSLKKFEVELGIHHQELALPWDEPVPKDKWEEVSEYCDNDVMATEAVWNHVKGDWIARQVLAKLSGLTVNDTTNSHSAKIIFGNNRQPQSEFNIPRLADTFPGYRFEAGKSYYRGEEVGEGGFVYSEPGIYYDAALLDIESMHPSSIEAMNLFGDVYTARFSALKQARLYIKHKEYDKLSQVLDGALSEFVKDIENGVISAKDLSNALKTVINSVYGLTAARFDNPFRHKRNIDNVVAKRGALFMIDLKNALQERGIRVAHIKTDSVKIPNATAEDIQFVMEFGKKYGYKFEHEATYDRMCLVNDAVYIAKYATGEDGLAGEWTATGAQFAHPYIFKTLFSDEPVKFEDLCEMKSVKSTMYLDMNEGLGEDEHNYVFVGRTGLFCPVVPGAGGGILVRTQNDKFNSVTGTKGYRWMDAEILKEKDWRNMIDYSYFEDLRDRAIATIEKYGSYQCFVNGDRPLPEDELPF